MPAIPVIFFNAYHFVLAYSYRVSAYHRRNEYLLGFLWLTILMNPDFQTRRSLADESKISEKFICSSLTLFNAENQIDFLTSAD
ncbi:MAG TPA: hypothetical protein PLR50_04390, partial [Candidatus Rifleibacterium sp.]|nr:hypothetical protein [Candidatus Rifleibacterium sp.]